MSEGVRGGSDKRPGSGPAEIEKLPTAVCILCRMRGVRALFADGQCRNVVACRKRVKKLPPDVTAAPAPKGKGKR